MPDDITLDEAFEVLQAAIEDTITSVQDQGADALRSGDLNAAQESLQQAQHLRQLREDLASLEDSFEAHIVPEITPESPVGRLPNGLKTSQEAYRIPILRALVDLGGRADINDVLDNVYDQIEATLNRYDHIPLASNSDMPRWRNTAQWARNALREKGYLESDSPRGIWEISEEGRVFLASQDT